MDTVYRKYFSFIPADNVIVTSRKQMVQGDVLIDDAPWNLEGGSYRKILFITQCNARYDAEAHGMERADGWADVYRIIQSIQKERGSA